MSGTDTTRETDAVDTTRGTDAADVALIGHRGCADQYPENTAHALARAAPHVDAVEVDVRRCASGELVVFHDEDLDRLTEATGRVADAEWSALRELTVLDSGEPIPRLREALAAVPSETAVNVELKERGLAADALAVAREADVDVWFSSFLPGALAALRDVDPAPETALLVDDGDADDVIERATELDCVAIHPAADLVTGPRFVETAHDAGVEVTAWTVTDRAEGDRLVAAGVDGLVVDRWDLFSDRE